MYTCTQLFLQCFDAVGWATGRLEKAGCWFVGSDNFTSNSSSCHHSPPPSSFAPIKSRMETFWYRLTQVEGSRPLKWKYIPGPSVSPVVRCRQKTRGCRLRACRNVAHVSVVCQAVQPCADRRRRSHHNPPADRTAVWQSPCPTCSRGNPCFATRRNVAVCS